MDIQQRIAQFENMVQADPENDMAHFSLGGAYNQAGRFDDAAASYKRCIELNPDLSKAYQLAGAALMATGKTDEAAQILTEGYTVAAERGDLMPKNAIKDLLEQLDAPIPEVKAQPGDGSQKLPEGAFVCTRTGRPGHKLPRPPFKGPVGAWIAENITQETWNDWINQGTKVINELRLDLSRDEDAEAYDQHMREFLGIDEELLEKLSAR